jgi:hypothetical protein
MMGRAPASNCTAIKIDDKKGTMYFITEPEEDLVLEPRYDKIQQFNAVNIENGYRAVAIYSPREVTYYE